ncbi:MAG: hypothetical protein U5K74_09385 [Gemmatimonadaceae bacterium]|nr:hypothetical protein [Gemmatimonadaceae bacterium]
MAGNLGGECVREVIAADVRSELRAVDEEADPVDVECGTLHPDSSKQVITRIEREAGAARHTVYRREPSPMASGCVPV